MNKFSFLIRSACVVAAVFIFSGCASTKISNEWKAPEIADAPFQKVMVMAITKQDGTRRLSEDAFVTELGSQGVGSYPYLETEGKKVPRKVVGEAVKEAGADAILTVSLVKTITKQNVVPDYSRASMYDGYYSSWYRVYDPMAVTAYEYDIVVLEVKLYDVKSESLVWSITTQNVDSGNMKTEIVPYAKTVVARLRKRGLI